MALTHSILTSIEGALCILYLLYLIYYCIDKKEKRWKDMVRVIATCVLFIINFVQCFLEIKLGMDYLLTICLSILWFVSAFLKIMYLSHTKSNTNVDKQDILI